MDATWVQIAQGTAAVVTILMAVAIGPIFKLLHKIKTNDLHHLALQIETSHQVLSGKIDSVASQVQQVTKRLDDHIQFHMENS